MLLQVEAHLCQAVMFLPSLIMDVPAITLCSVTAFKSKTLRRFIVFAFLLFIAKNYNKVTNEVGTPRFGTLRTVGFGESFHSTTAI